MFGGFPPKSSTQASQTPPKADATEVTLCQTCRHETFRDEWAKVGRYCARDGHAVRTAADHGKCLSEDEKIKPWYEKRT